VRKKKLADYLQKKQSELTNFEKQQIRSLVEAGETSVYKLAREFGCVPTQIAGIKAHMHRK
jgi:transposase-like protein